MKSKTNEVVFVLADFFTEYLPNTKGLSDNTIVSYQYAFQLLFNFLDEKKHMIPEKVTFESLSVGKIEEFLAYIETERGCSVKTRNIRRAAIKAFAKYSAKKAFSASLPFYSAAMSIEKKKEPKSDLIRYFTREEIVMLLKLPDTTMLIGQRNVTLMALLYATGARAQELCDITLKDIALATPSSPTKVRLTGKPNKKTRVVTIPDTCTAILKEYLRSKSYDVKNTSTYDRHLFSTQTNEHMSIACVEDIVKKYVTLAKERYPDSFRQGKYTPHSFRHSIAVHMLEAGESLVVIKAFLGHASIASTVVYAKVTPELANKYLNERGKPLENIATQSVPQSLPEKLPFLYKDRAF
jgi:site-specific recombinase XerD